jgi:tetratricopeptide (TPR) repeat protein
MYKHIGLFLLFVMIFSAIPTTIADSNCDFTYSNYARAVQLHDMKDYTRALHHYECAIEHDPDNQILPQLIDDVHQDMGDLEITPTFYEVSDPFGITLVSNATCDLISSDYFKIGMEQYTQGSLVTALAYFECALLDMPDDPTLLTMIGSIHGNMGDIRSAHYYFNRIETNIALNSSVMADPSCDPTISHYAQGTQLHGMGDIARAITAYECALIQDPNRVAVITQLAQIYVEIEDYDTALTYLTQALELDNQNAVLYSQRGYVNYHLDRLQEALIDLDTALGLNPNLKATQETRALVLEALGQVEVVSIAIPASKNALPQLDDNFADGSLALPVAEAELTSPMADTLRQSAHEFFGETEFELALQQYEALLGFGPNNVSAHFSIGYSYYALKNPAQAVGYLQQALHLQPNHLYAKYLLAMSYSMLDMPLEARSIMSTIYGTGEVDGSYPLALGHVLRNLGYVEAAGTEFYIWLQQHESIRLLSNPLVDNIPMTLVMDYGVVHGVRFQATAGNIVQISVESHMLNPVPIDPLIVVLNSSGHPVAGDDDSGELFDAALNFIPPATGNYTLLISHAGGRTQGDLTLTMTGGTAWTPNTYRSRAQYALEHNLYRVSVGLISKAIALDGGTYNDYMMRAYAYRQMNQMMRAISDYSMALEISPYPEDVYANLGQTYRIMGDLESATIAYSQALAINPALDAVRCELGMIYVTLEDYPSAIQQFDILLSQNSADTCASPNRRATLRLMRDLPIQNTESSTRFISDDNEVEATYNMSMMVGVYALMDEAQARYEKGDVWLASALLDRYIDEHYATACSTDLLLLADNYRELGYTVMANMLQLKAIGDTTC